MIYSPKIKYLLSHLDHVGSISDEMMPVRGLEKGRTYILCFYWILDQSRTKIEKARFQAFGPTPLLAFAEFLSIQAESKSISLLKKLSLHEVENLLQESKEVPPFPVDAFFYLDIAFLAMKKALLQCTPISREYPAWDKSSDEEKKEMVEMILDQEVRPYLAFDQGGIQVISIEGDEIKVLYEGACSTCISSEGSTLQFVEEALRPLCSTIKVKVIHPIS